MEPTSLRAIAERLGRCPVTAVVVVLAAGVSFLRWGGRDVTPLFLPSGDPGPDAARLLGAILPHGGMLHLLFNLCWTVILGLRLEERLGSLRLLGLLLALAVGSSSWQWVLSGPGIGLSGVVYGYFGVLWALDRWDPRWRGAMDRETVKVFAGWFLLCLVLTHFGLLRIGNAAHGSGAILGGLAGAVLARGAPARRAGAAGAAGLGILLGAAAAVGGWSSLLDPGGAAMRRIRASEEALKEGNPEGALALVDEGLDRDPERAVLHFQRGRILQRLERWEEALAAYGEAVRLDPESGIYLRSLEDLRSWLRAVRAPPGK